jgi:hypothetical protein
LRDAPGADARAREARVDIAGWLRELGLGQYEPAFRENDIDFEMLRSLTIEDLRDLGIASIAIAAGCSMRSRRCPPRPRRDLRPLRSRPAPNAAS